MPFCKESYGCVQKSIRQSDDLTNILIFGVTGMIGEAVANTAVASMWFRVFGFTRQDINNEKYKTILKDVTLVNGDLSDYDSVVKATKNMDVIFLSTFFWESMNARVEYLQGRNVVNAALENGVKLLIYNGTDYNWIADDSSRCTFLEGKSLVTNYIIYSGIPYTIVRLSWFYDNLLSVFRPHPVSTTAFAIALPLEGSAINMGSLRDFAQSIVKIAQRFDSNIDQVYSLSANYLTITEMCNTLHAYFPKYTFFDPKIDLDAYHNFGFKSAIILSTMFRHYKTQTQWDTKDMRRFVTNIGSFNNWIAVHQKELQCVFEEQLYENAETLHQLAYKKREAKKGRKAPSMLERVKEMTFESCSDTLGLYLGFVKETQL